MTLPCHSKAHSGSGVSGFRTNWFSVPARATIATALLRAGHAVRAPHDVAIGCTRNFDSGLVRVGSARQVCGDAVAVTAMSQRGADQAIEIGTARSADVARSLRTVHEGAMTVRCDRLSVA